VVREVWGEVLGLAASGIDAHASFRALGGTSLKAMEVLAVLEDRFGVPLEPAALRASADTGADTGADTVAGVVDQLLAETGGELPAPRGPAGGDPRPEDDGESIRTVDAGARAADAGRRAECALAVIGLSCRFPGADTPEAYWKLLAEGRDAVTPVPPHRWDGDRASRWGAFLTDPAGFDAARFGIGAEEARALDPAARLLLELAHEALERAGYAGPCRRAHRVGVFTTAGESGYREILEREGTALPPSALTGNLPGLLAARIAQTFDLDGPALVVDTACSSGLVALHLARRSLLAGECDIALVGGVNLHLTPTAPCRRPVAAGRSPRTPTVSCRVRAARCWCCAGPATPGGPATRCTPWCGAPPSTTTAPR
jgi:acyl carrier protein